MTGFFLNYGPRTKGAFLGSARVVLWGGLTGTYLLEVACYQNEVLQQIQAVVAGNPMQGTYITPDGSISWLVDKAGGFSLGILPNDGASNLLNGQF
jgi:hypothetical protein